MPYQNQPGKVYYHVLEGSRFLIADERSKKKLLDIVFDVQRRERWSIYAFCATDDSVFFVTWADCRSSINRGCREMKLRFLEDCVGLLPYFQDVLPSFHHRILEELRTPGEIAGRCRLVHRLPVDRGYVTRLGDYWWSSYITYMGQYDWGMVDCRVLMEYLSADSGEARRQIRRFHQYRPLISKTEK